MKRLFFATLLALCAFGAAAKDTFQSAVAIPPAPQPSLYSFADVYRLTVGGPISTMQASQLGESPVRVAVTQGAGAPEQQFSISAVREPGRWTLLMAGLLLMAWVAWRRMDFTL
jgi:hypothetical protein